MKTYEEGIAFLDKIPQFTTSSGPYSVGINRAKEVLNRLSNPEKSVKCIHIAGTNGKGSTAAFLEACLIKKGLKVGLFTSPHLLDPRERIKVNGQMIDKETFVRFLNLILEVTAKDNFTLAYFDYFFLIAMLWYEEIELDIAIIETGLGGKLDASNALGKPLIDVITSISLEHTEILGNTIEEITKEKVGIVREGVNLILSCQDLENENIIKSLVKEEAFRHKSPFLSLSRAMIKEAHISPDRIDFSIENEYYKNVAFKLKTPAFYEAENALTALSTLAVFKELAVVEVFSGNINNKDCEDFKEALFSCSWEGRMEQLREGIYLDGAHNPQGVKAFLKSAKDIIRDREATLLFSVVCDKNFDIMIEDICKSGIFKTFVVTGVETSRALPIQQIIDTFKKYTNKPVEVRENIEAAFITACKKDTDFLFCLGSLYLVAEIKALLKDK